MFCPVKYGKKVDPQGIYIKSLITNTFLLPWDLLVKVDFCFFWLNKKRKYCPELKDFPLEFLYEPWKAPLSVQEEADCVVGRDYPEPCIDHEQTFKENIAKLQQFFHTEKKEIFEMFLYDKFVLKPANSEEYKVYTYAEFLNSEFADF